MIWGTLAQLLPYPCVVWELSSTRKHPEGLGVVTSGLSLQGLHEALSPGQACPGLTQLSKAGAMQSSELASKHFSKCK